jgi:hypothetical protein
MPCDIMLKFSEHIEQWYQSMKRGYEHIEDCIVVCAVRCGAAHDAIAAEGAVDLLGFGVAPTLRHA